jgi:hypothetical protein
MSGISSGYPTCGHMTVLSFFMAGREMVRWELLAIESPSAYKLTLHHAHGVIVEYFKTSAAALVRQHELEDLLIAARGGVAVR